MEVSPSDMGQIRVFPRAQWRKLGKGNFCLNEIARGMTTRQHTVDSSFLAKIDAIRKKLLEEEAGLGAVILIGLNENEPLTVLDGNHRLVSALLESPINCTSCDSCAGSRRACRNAAGTTPTS